jgi:hypothetical protein
MQGAKLLSRRGSHGKQQATKPISQPAAWPATPLETLHPPGCVCPAPADLSQSYYVGSTTLAPEDDWDFAEAVGLKHIEAPLFFSELLLPTCLPACLPACPLPTCLPAWACPVVADCWPSPASLLDAKLSKCVALLSLCGTCRVKERPAAHQQHVPSTESTKLI